MSYNNLSVMPSGPQLQTLNNQIYIYVGNPGLCGPPLLKNCSINGAKQSDNNIQIIWNLSTLGWHRICSRSLDCVLYHVNEKNLDDCLLSDHRQLI